MRVKFVKNPLTSEQILRFDQTLNPDIDVHALSKGSGKKIWWKCNNHPHSFLMRTADFASGHDCYYCSGNRALAGFNDFASIHPNIAHQWHPTKNADSPQKYTSGSKHVAWWLCEQGHEWQTSIGNRCVNNTGCPTCAGNVCTVGVNDLLTCRPDIAQQLHPTKNGDQDFTKITVASTEKKWWLCERGHETYVSVSERTRKNAKGCKYCAGTALMVGITDLASTHPQVLVYWSSENTIKPTEVSSKSTRKVYWTCANHLTPITFSLTIREYLRHPAGWCSACAGTKFIIGGSDLRSQFPNIANQLDEFASEFKADEVSPSDTRIGYWQCDLGQNHSYPMRVVTRVTGNGSCTICSNKVVLTGFNDLATTHPDLANQWDHTKNPGYSPDNVHKGSSFVIDFVCPMGHGWSNRLIDAKMCQTCSKIKHFTSKPEQKIADWLKTIGLVVKQNDRSVLKGQDLDIYLPDQKLAVEYNGLYWHSETCGKGKWYHHDKWANAEAAGVQLLHIWEDDWRQNPDLVKEMILHKAGLSNRERVHARSCEVKQLSYKEVEQFLQNNHIQGPVAGSYYLSLMPKAGAEPVAVMVLKKEAGTAGRTLNILRFATSKRVPGGFTKLLGHAINKYNPQHIITFSDHGISDGGLYAKTGFIADRELDPDYMYVAQNVRRHKFGYRLKRFREDPSLRWDPNLSESQLAKLNGILKIWDAGKTRWVLNVTRKESQDDSPS